MCNKPKFILMHQSHKQTKPQNYAIYGRHFYFPNKSSFKSESSLWLVELQFQSAAFMSNYKSSVASCDPPHPQHSKHAADGEVDSAWTFDPRVNRCTTGNYWHISLSSFDSAISGKMLIYSFNLDSNLDLFNLGLLTAQPCGVYVCLGAGFFHN